MSLIISPNTAISAHSTLSGRDVVDSHPASAITNTPAGNITSIDVQAALNELDTKKMSINDCIVFAIALGG